MIGNEVSGKSPRVCFIPGTVSVFLFITPLSLLPRTAAYKHADGKKIDGKRVVVDVERGRTVKSWKPRRLGEGKHYLLLIIGRGLCLGAYFASLYYYPVLRKRRGRGGLSTLKLFMPGRIHC